MRGKLFGRHPLTIGALILLGLSIYEIWIRFDDFQAWILGVKHLSDVRGTPFLEDLAIIFEVPEMQQLGFKMLYLAAVIIFSIICLARRNRWKGMWLHLLFAFAFAAAGIWLEIYALSTWVQLIKLIPLALIAIGSISNMVLHREQKKLSQKDSPPRIPDQRSGSDR